MKYRLLILTMLLATSIAYAQAPNHIDQSIADGIQDGSLRVVKVNKSVEPITLHFGQSKIQTRDGVILTAKYESI